MKKFVSILMIISMLLVFQGCTSNGDSAKTQKIDAFGIEVELPESWEKEDEIGEDQIYYSEKNSSGERDKTLNFILCEETTVEAEAKDMFEMYKNMPTDDGTKIEDIKMSDFNQNDISGKKMTMMLKKGSVANYGAIAFVQVDENVVIVALGDNHGEKEGIEKIAESIQIAE